MMAEMCIASALDLTRRLKTPIDPSCVGNDDARTFFPIPLKRHFPKCLGNTLQFRCNYAAFFGIYDKFWTIWKKKKNERPSLKISKVIDFERIA